MELRIRFEGAPSPDGAPKPRSRYRLATAEPFDWPVVLLKTSTKKVRPETVAENATDPSPLASTLKFPYRLPVQPQGFSAVQESDEVLPWIGAVQLDPHRQRVALQLELGAPDNLVAARRALYKRIGALQHRDGRRAVRLCASESLRGADPEREDGQSQGENTKKRTPPARCESRPHQTSSVSLACQQDLPATLQPPNDANQPPALSPKRRPGDPLTALVENFHSKPAGRRIASPLHGTSSGVWLRSGSAEKSSAFPRTIQNAVSLQHSDVTTTQNKGRSGRWAKGVSGNPGGRPKGLARATRELVGEDGMALVELWWQIAQDPMQRTRDRLEASKLLADRGWGKAAVFAPQEGDPFDLEEVEAAAEEFRAMILRLAPDRD